MRFRGRRKHPAAHSMPRPDGSPPVSTANFTDVLL